LVGVILWVNRTGKPTVPLKNSSSNMQIENSAYEESIRDNKSKIEEINTAC
jgi:hypothetical protein